MPLSSVSSELEQKYLCFAIIDSPVEWKVKLTWMA
jgi:hypothetical protein